MRVKVYRNLRRDTFSIMADEGPEKGRVIDHSDRVFLTDVTFKVSEAGRERVRRERRKNVHAFVCGERVAKKPAQFNWVIAADVVYNPYRVDRFIVPDPGMLWEGREIESADFVDLCMTGNQEPHIWAYGARFWPGAGSRNG